MTRERNRKRREIRVLNACAVTPEQVGFPGACTIARLRRLVRRKGQQIKETVYLISSLTLDQLDAQGLLKHKRGYWVIESRLHHPLDVSLREDQSRVRHRQAAWNLASFRRLVVSLAWQWVDKVRRPSTRPSVGKFQKRFSHHGSGPRRLHDLIFASQPTAWLCAA